jgi:hypothetical protein
MSSITAPTQSPQAGGKHPSLGRETEDAVDLAARLFRQEFESIRVQVESGFGSNALKSLDERGRAQELVRQQYSARYPFELLQNASDAALDTGTAGRARFLLTGTALVVADTGSGFGEKQVHAICSLGRSSKDPGSSIGHKGLGFKSVGEITDQPQVIAAQASFQFDGHRLHEEMLALFGSLPAEQKFPVYAFPFPVTDDDLGSDAASVRQLRAEGFRTVIRLPLRPGVTRDAVAAHLAECLLPRLLLFLPGIDRLELRGSDSDFSARVAKDPADGPTRVLLKTDSGTEEWLVYDSSMKPDPDVLEPLGEAWTRLDEVHYAVAVPLDQSSQPRVDETFPLHVYFPTEEEAGLHMAVHAEWVLGMDRRQLAVAPEAEPYNEMLLREVAAFVAAEVAPDLVARCGMSAQAVEVLVPASEAPAGSAGHEFRRQWSDSLCEARFLPSAAGSLRTAGEVRMLPDTLPSYSAAHALAALDGNATLRTDVEDLPAVRAFLTTVPAAKEMSPTGFIRLLKPPAPSTVSDYYAFLISWKGSIGYQVTAVLKDQPSVLTVNGDVVTPAEHSVFLPRVRGDSPVIDMPVPLAEVPSVDGVESFLRELGVRPFEWRDLIRDYLIKILSDPDADQNERDRAMAGLRAYHRDRASSSEDLALVLSRVLLPTRSADGTNRGKLAAARIYFGADWTGSDDLEVIYGPFGKPEFLDVDVPADPEQRRVDLDFYRMLGVEDHPRIDTVTSGGYWVGGGRHPHRGPLFDRWMRQPQVQEAARCPANHDRTQLLRTSSQLDRHLELIESSDVRRMIALWDQLARHWATVYEPAMEAVLRCPHGWHNGDSDRTCESLFAYAIRSLPWVPVAVGETPKLVRPEDAWIDATDTPRRIRERIPRISMAMSRTRGGPALIAELNLTDAARPKVTDLLSLLRSIADEADNTGTVGRDTELAARWVQRTLNDALDSAEPPHPEPRKVRLLASHDGTLIFTAQPPYADDPLLRETWARRSPVFAAEVGLGRLTRFLSLTRLDDAVHTSADPCGIHVDDAAFNTTRKRIDRVKPYLLALVRAENSTAEARARSLLRNMELVVCDELVLCYEYDGIQVERPDATCYIAAHREGRRAQTMGTAYLELDQASGQPHWFSVGRHLALHLGIAAQADAFAMLFAVPQSEIDRMMADRQIQRRDITEARRDLQLPDDDEQELQHVLDALLPAPADSEQPAAPGTANSEDTGTPADVGSPPESQGSGGGTETPAAAAAQPAAQPTAPPPVDLRNVTMNDAKPGTLTPSKQADQHTGSGGGSYSSVPSGQADENRRIGKRGERIAYRKEQERVRDLGKNPDAVVWVSQTNELSPFDIKSIDENGQIICIEVKSTKSDDPSEPFYISQAELDEAISKRGRYYIYRVTSTDTAVPQITRIADPLALVVTGNARLLLANARMTIALDTDQ